MECEGCGQAAPQSAALAPASGPRGAQPGITRVRAWSIKHAQMKCPLEELLVTLTHPHTVMHIDFWNLKIADTTGWPKCPFEEEPTPENNTTSEEVQQVYQLLLQISENASSMSQVARSTRQEFRACSQNRTSGFH